jgi:RimJ/RimL family protein N-acetyltransferase
MLADQSELAKTLIVREPRESDDETYARLISMLMTAPYDVEALRERRMRYGHKQWFVRVAELDGRVVGVLELVESGAKQNAMCRVAVEAASRRQGVGSALMKSAQASPLYFCPKVFSQGRDDEPDSAAFAERYGFERTAHVFESFIDPSAFDLDEYLPAIESVRNSGLRIATLAELGSSDETRYMLWEIEHITDHDIPGLDPDHLPSWEDASKSWYKASWFNPEAEFIALDGERFVGLSGVAEMAPGTWSILHTCTLREYRGRGIATALKALATDYAKRKGSRRLKTNNHSGNAAMLAINQRFGFQPLPGWFDYTKLRRAS